jgi:hypothetical protein
MEGMAMPAYRIEHHRGHDARMIIAFCDKARQPQTTLAPCADQLLAEGETGESVPSPASGCPKNGPLCDRWRRPVFCAGLRRNHWCKSRSKNKILLLAKIDRF